MDSKSDESPVNGVELGFLPRPMFQLRSLPIRYRWEVNRRHPHYQDWWRYARAHFRNEPISNPREPLLRECGVAFLEMIGVVGDPPDPTVEFEELGAESLNAGWLSGAVQPITLRGLAGLLIAALPREIVGLVGLRFIDASKERYREEDDPSWLAQALIELQELDHPALDSYLDEPIVAINPAASGRKVNAAIGILLQQWKEQRELTELRDRSDKFDEYLQVWDLREGWSAGAYDRALERKLMDVAADLDTSIGTVNNRYRSAFELILGHAYSPDLWYRVMGPHKLSELFGQQVGPVSAHRPLKSPSRIVLPESVLRRRDAEIGQLGPASSAPAAAGDQDLRDLINDIRELLKRGLADEEIAKDLELSSAAVAAITSMRTRMDELQ